MGVDLRYNGTGSRIPEPAGIHYIQTVNGDAKFSDTAFFASDLEA